MQNEQQIVEYFEQEIANEAKKESEAIMKEVEQIRQDALQKIRNSAAADAKAKMNREINDIILENQKEISRMQRKINQDLIKKRQELQNQIFDICRKKLIEFVQGNDYLAFIEKEIANLPKEIYDGKTEIRIAQRDEKVFKDLEGQFKQSVEITTDPQLSIGGFIAVNMDLGMIVDSSLDHRLEEKKEWFYNHSGLVIQ